MAQMSDASTPARFDGVRTRLLDDHERPYGTMEAGVPLVIEPGPSRSVTALTTFLGAHSREIMEAIYRHGAILFRGFEISTEREFESAITSVRGVHPMSRYFMAEPGREQVPGTGGVFNTNTYSKTGGSLFMTGFHSENYYSTDVPALQSFWCKTEPWLGGETGLIHMANGYGELGSDLRAKLEGEPLASKQWLLSDVAKEYRLPEDLAEGFFRELGLLITTPDGQKVVFLHKPAVYCHPHNGKRSLQVNLAGEVKSVNPILNRLFAPSYASQKWALHRLAWSRPLVAQAWFRLERLPEAVRYPKIVGKEEWAAVVSVVNGLRRRSRRGPISGGKPPRPAPSGATGGSRAQTSSPPPEPTSYGIVRLGEKLSREEVEALAMVAWKHTSVFTWRRGDVLLFDNLQMLHGGMPGLGPRVIRVMMCNPIPLRYPFTTGLVDVALDEGYRSIDDRLRALQRSLS